MTGNASCNTNKINGLEQPNQEVIKTLGGKNRNIWEYFKWT